jgi:hypothetical protein
MRIVTTRASQPATAGGEAPTLFHLLKLPHRPVRFCDIGRLNEDRDELLKW